MSWVVQGYQKFGRQKLVEWIVLPEWVSDQTIADGVGMPECVRSGAWPVSNSFASRLETISGSMFRRRRFLAKIEYFVEFVADVG